MSKSSATAIAVCRNLSRNDDWLRLGVVQQDDDPNAQRLISLFNGGRE
jgi:hypothetical protein